MLAGLATTTGDVMPLVAAQAQSGGLGSIKPLSGHELLLVLLQFGLLLLVAESWARSR